MDTDTHDFRTTEYLTTDQLAALLHLPPSTLKYFRSTGDGPPFLKIGRRVIYPMRNVNKWLENRLRRSTADASAQAE